MKLSVAIAVCGLAVPTIASAQAFGVRMGAPASEYHGHRTGSGSDATTLEITVPEPNSEFESYVAIATPSSGICKVIGIGKTHMNDEYGSDVRSAFVRFRDTLKGRYGKSTDFDFLKSGAIWDGPREWVWSIFKNERVLASFWTSSDGASLPPTVRAIGLEAKSVNPSSGAYISLGYEFANFDQCKQSIQNSENNGL